MRSSFIAVLTVACLYGAAPELFAQEAMQLESGERVRLTTPALPASRRIVQVVSASRDSIVFVARGERTTRTLALADITAVDVSLGRRRQTRKGMLIGLATGIPLGSLLGYVSFEACNKACFLVPLTARDAAIWGGVGGGLAGLMTGAMVGTVIGSEKWQRVHPNTRITFGPVRGKNRVSVSFAF